MIAACHEGEHSQADLSPQLLTRQHHRVCRAARQVKGSRKAGPRQCELQRRLLGCATAEEYEE